MLGLDNFILSSPATWLVDIYRVADIIDHRVLDWNHQAVKLVFTHQQDITIFSIPVALVSTLDFLVWHYAHNGHVVFDPTINSSCVAHLLNR